MSHVSLNPKRRKNECALTLAFIFAEDYLQPGIWSLVEVDIAVLCACMPGIRALLLQAWPTVFGSTQNQSKYSNQRSRNNGSQVYYPSKKTVNKSKDASDFVELDSLHSERAITSRVGPA